jgi:hypothetical protein
MSSTPRRKARLNLEALERRDAPAGGPAETFDDITPGTLPPGWRQWADAGASFAVAAGQGVSGTAALRTSAASNVSARAWPAVLTGADTTVSAAVFVDSLVPVEVFNRGRRLEGNDPTFYAVTATRGTRVDLVRSLNGVRTTLGSVTTADYVSYRWLQVTLRSAGNQHAAEVRDAATGQYLTPTGGWQDQPIAALAVTDSAITGGGRVGVNRPSLYAGAVALDNFAIAGPGVEPPGPGPISVPNPVGSQTQSFDGVAVGALPAGWSQAGSQGPTFAVTSGLARSQPNGLTTNAATGRTGLTWNAAPIGPNAEVTSSVYLSTLIPALVIARGSALETATPTYYAAQLTRGLTLQLTKTVDGVAQTLATGQSTAYFSQQWARVTLRVQADRVRVRVTRSDTGQHLAPDGSWTDQPAWFREVTDGSIAGGSLAGLGRGGVYAGAVTFDDFTTTRLGGTPGDTTPPVVTLPLPGNGTVSGTVPLTAQASDDVAVTRVEFYLDGQLQATRTAAPYTWEFNSAAVSNGQHTVWAKAYDAAGNVGQASVTLTVDNTVVGPPGVGVPAIPRHYQHVRVAQLAYYGTPMTAFEQNLLQNSIDVVVPNPAYLATINNYAPDTPQLVYTNVSNLYEGLLLDWLNYADAKGLSREQAFYHVSGPSNFSGGSPSSQPVNWLWRVARGTTDLTGASRTGTTGDVAFGGLAGETTLFGYPDKFRELNFAITTPRGAGWSAVYEYPTAVDANHQPTAWAALPIASDTTNGLAASGRVTFDPPADWKASVASGSNRLHFVRLRVVAGGAAPVAATVLGRDYVNANGGNSGVVPAFDAAADANGDGHLTDAEYANRAAGKDARFAYESRLFYPAYGQMRFATNPAPQGVKDWAADYHVRSLASLPLADGLFMDNSNGKSPLEGIAVLESAADYAAQTGQLLAQLGQAIAPRWILANTAGGGAYTSAVVQSVPASFEEFVLRPMSATWSRFHDIAGLVASRLAAPNGPYLVLDSHPQGGSITDARTQLATLAYYYLLGDANRTFLMYYGGYEPASSWTRHWVPATAFDVGAAAGNWSEWAAGADPANAALNYKVFRRDYTNAVVLYKPLSYKVAVGTGTTADNTATTHALGGNYRALNADGSLGPVVTSVTLRNGEGAILIRQ